MLSVCCSSHKTMGSHRGTIYFSRRYSDSPTCMCCLCQCNLLLLDRSLSHNPEDPLTWIIFCYAQAWTVTFLGVRVGQWFVVLALHPHPAHDHPFPPVHLEAPVLQVLDFIQTSIRKQIVNFIFCKKVDTGAISTDVEIFRQAAASFKPKLWQIISAIISEQQGSPRL